MDQTLPLYGAAARAYHARVPYLAPFFTALAEKLIADRSAKLLDLAAGPGPVAAGLSPYVGQCLMVDSDPAMLAEAHRRAYAPGCAVRFLEARVEQLPDDCGVFDLATIGRALHWLPREATLAKLAAHIRRGGHVVVCEAGVLGSDNNPWYPAYLAIRSGTFGVNPGRLGERAPAFFTGGSFRLGERVSLRATKMTPVEDLVERMFSYAQSSREKLGAAASAKEAELRRALEPYATEQGVAEVIYNTAVTFRRT